ncbi:unnamed protein product [Closterium sp. Naga37s-1]|nr:unnamed protein product [Closterium sp. Naga37s-1]
MNVNYKLPVTEGSPECTNVPELGSGETCPAVSVYKSYGVQIGMVSDIVRRLIGSYGEQFAWWALTAFLAPHATVSPPHTKSLPFAYPPAPIPYPAPFLKSLSPPLPFVSQGTVYGRVDVLRSMVVRIDSLKVTGVPTFNKSPGAIRVAMSGYGPDLLRAQIVLSSNEALTPRLFCTGAPSA